MKRTISWLVLPAVLLLPACQRKPAGGGEGEPSRPASIPLDQARAALRATYRLAPDQRFLLAVAAVHHFFTGQPMEPATAAFKNDRWRISYRSQAVGELAEFPDFPELLAALTEWSRTVSAGHPIQWTGKPAQEAKELPFLAPELIPELRRINELWTQQPGVLLLQAATRALTSLTLQHADLAGVGDALPARAVAMLAITRAVTRAPMLHQECLLAQAMGYTGHALRIAQQLPPDDAARLFLLEDAQLQEAARSPGASAELRYLALISQGRLDDPAALPPAPDLFPRELQLLPALQANLIHGDNKSQEAAREQLPSLVLGLLYEECRPSFLERISAGFSWGFFSHGLPRWTARLEAYLPVYARRLRGPFWEGDVAAAWFRAAFYSPVMAQGLQLLDAVAPQPAEEFASRLVRGNAPYARDFQRWYFDLVEARAGRLEPQQLIDDLGTLSTLGGGPLERTLAELVHGTKRPAASDFRLNDPRLLDGVRRLSQRLDTRPEYRRALGEAMRDVLADGLAAEQLFAAAVNAAPFDSTDLRTWIAYQRADRTALLSLLESSETRGAALDTLASLPPRDWVPVAEWKRAFRAWLDQRPNNWNARARYIAFLEQRKDYSEGRAVIGEWLRLQAAGRQAEPAERATLTRLLLEERRYAEGLAELQPLLDAGDSLAWMPGAVLLQKLGRAQEAEKLFLKVLQGSPKDITALAAYVQLLWTESRDQEAAMSIQSRSPAPGPEEMAVLGEAFAELFARRPKQKGIAAFAPLAGSGLSPVVLEEMIAPVARAGNYELAFEMQSRLEAEEPEETQLALRAHRYLHKWLGKDGALSWLRSKIPMGRLNASARLIVEESAQDEFDLLWDLILNPQGQDAETVWLMRAATFLSRPKKDPRHGILLRYYSQPGASLEHVLGRFLTGQTAEGVVVAQATTPARSCQAAFFLGLKAGAEGRAAESREWYRVAVETKAEDCGEYPWAWRQLRRLSSAASGVPLSTGTRSVNPMENKS